MEQLRWRRAKVLSRHPRRWEQTRESPGFAPVDLSASDLLQSNKASRSRSKDLKKKDRPFFNHETKEKHIIKLGFTKQTQL